MTRYAHGYALFSPSLIVIPDTFDVDRENAESKAYDYLSRVSRWATDKKFWKQWDLFVAERQRRGWVVLPVGLSAFKLPKPKS